MMRNADRRHRVLLKSPQLKDRMFVKISFSEVDDLFKNIGLAHGEQVFLQTYVDDGWMTRKSRSA